MSKKGALFYLIQSLDKSEKRYFKIFCVGQKVNKNYVKLFEVIQKQQEYDEKAIRKRFIGEAFLLQLHVTKHYLYQLILKSLRNFHQKSSPLAEARACLHNIELLFDRELYDHCHYEILKVEKLAIKYELQNIIAEVAGWKRKFHLARQQKNPVLLQQFNEQQLDALQNQLQINQYWHFSNHIFDYIADKQGKLLKQKPFSGNQLPNQLEGKILHHHILYVYYTINRQTDKAIQEINLQIKAIEAYPEHIKKNPTIYLSALNNKISYFIHQQRQEEAIEQLSYLRKIATQYQSKSQRLTVRTLLRSYNIELEVYRDTKDTTQGLLLLEEVLAFLKKHINAVPQEYYLLLWYQFAHLQFMHGDLSQAQYWVNQIINTRFTEGRHDLERYARLLNLIIHYELDNIMVLRYSVDNTRRFLKKQNKLQPFEKALLRFFSKACKSPKAALKDLEKQLYQRLFIVEPILANKNILDYFDFRGWLEARA